MYQDTDINKTVSTIMDLAVYTVVIQVVSESEASQLGPVAGGRPMSSLCGAATEFQPSFAT